MSKTSGKANIVKIPEDLGLDLDEESMRKILGTYYRTG